jgi:hypothetical protein
MKIFSIIASSVLLIGTAVWMYLFFNKDKKETETPGPATGTTPTPPKPRTVAGTQTTVDEFTGYENVRVIIDKKGLIDDLNRQSGDYCRTAEGLDGAWGKDRRNNWTCKSGGVAS